MTKIRTRYAPSPTGFLHIGNARTALFAYLFAKKNKGDFILRIEDTDIERNVKDGEKSQNENLEWLGIFADESPNKPNKDFQPYRQLERLEIYEKYSNELLKRNLAYKCNCSDEKIEKERQKAKLEKKAYLHKCNCDTKQEQINSDFVIRFKVPENKEYKWNDLVRNQVSFLSKDIGDWVIIKRNKIPTYNFACVIDDHLMQISHVLRGEDHISNTPKQIMIYQAFKWEIPNFAHLSLILNKERKKLSKRDVNVKQFIEDYKKLGYLPESIINFLALLGWSDKENKEIFSKEELIEKFELEGLSKSGAIFDEEKLNFINNEHIKMLSNEEYLEKVKPFLLNKIKKDDYKENYINDVCLLYKKQITFLDDIYNLSKIFFTEKITPNTKASEILKLKKSQELITWFEKEIKNLEKKEENIKALIKKASKELNLKGKELFMPLRIYFTGVMSGPDLAKTIELFYEKQ